MLRVFAPAKLNLYLRVLDRRPDGFHEIETLFERIDLCDELTVAAHASDLSLVCDDPRLPTDETNLIFKAASLMRSTNTVTQGATFHVKKRIPIGAGLGGGSSDAAATLLALNELWKLSLTREALLGLAAQLGSDVPFFIWQSNFGIGRGRGERCEIVETGDVSLWHVLIFPNVNVSTKEIYDGLAQQRKNLSKSPESALTASPPSISMSLHALRNGSLSELAEGLWNELAPEAIRRCPVIQELYTRLRHHGCVGVLMSGSGSAVFGLCRDELHARDAARRIQIDAPADWDIRVVRTWPT